MARYSARYNIAKLRRSIIRAFMCLMLMGATVSTLMAKDAKKSDKKNAKDTDIEALEEEEEVKVEPKRRLFAPPSSTTGLTVEESVASGLALDEFRRGVQAYYRGSYNDAIMQFEKALSYKPSEDIILDWLGRAYYMSGIEGVALQQWQTAYDRGYGGLLLENRMETVRVRRSDSGSRSKETKLTQTGSYEGVSQEQGLIFSSPISSLPLPNGTTWVLAYGSNELLRFDINGYIVDRIRGPLNGFDRPMDIVRLQSGNLLVSEYMGDRLALLSPKGIFIKYIGSRGRGDGEFIGPQYLAEDSIGNIYVSDFGNSRVVVFDKEGAGLFSFGRPTSEFKGFKGPTGIAILGDTVYVADCIVGCIYMFDTAGNYKGQLVKDNSFSRPEAIKVADDYLIVADTNRVVSVDSQSGVMFENARLGNAPMRVTSATVDCNGNVVVTDFKGDEVGIMTRMSDIVGGMLVQIQRVDASKFPEVTLDVKVENRRREPVVGLNEENFYVSEDKNTVAAQTLLGAAYNNDTCDITLIIDRSLSTKDYEERIEHAVQEIAQSMVDTLKDNRDGPGTIRLVSAGKIPLVEYVGPPDKLLAFNITSLKTPYTSEASIDLSIRLSSNELINAAHKRAIFFITDGNLVGKTSASLAFSQYGLADLSAFMNNNSISFSLVNLTEDIQETEELNFLVRNSKGKNYYVYRPQGLNGLIRDVLDLPIGIYQLRYTSSLATGYGRDYLPVEVETYVNTRSGRDEIGYFAPLE